MQCSLILQSYNTALGALINGSVANPAEHLPESSFLLIALIYIWLL